MKSEDLEKLDTLEKLENRIKSLKFWIDFFNEKYYSNITTHLNKSLSEVEEKLNNYKK